MQAYDAAFIERFWAKVHKTNHCWLWTASLKPAGYGQIRYRGKTLYAHRVAYELLVGPIPLGTELDHIKDRPPYCSGPACCNPAHLEAVTHSENSLRGNSPNAINARKTHCKRGHPLTPENLVSWRKDRPGKRKCNVCRKFRKNQKYRERKRK